MRDTPWKMWDILAVDDHHIITKRKRLWDNTRIDDVLTNSPFITHIRFEEFGYDIEEFTPIYGQLLDYAEAVQITETANPDAVPFLFDLSRPVNRLTSGTTSPGMSITGRWVDIVGTLRHVSIGD
jgi:hypothetical protein